MRHVCPCDRGSRHVFGCPDVSVLTGGFLWIWAWSNIFCFKPAHFLGFSLVCCMVFGLRPCTVWTLGYYFNFNLEKKKTDYVVRKKKRILFETDDVAASLVRDKLKKGKEAIRFGETAERNNVDGGHSSPSSRYSRQTHSSSSPLEESPSSSSLTSASSPPSIFFFHLSSHFSQSVLLSLSVYSYSFKIFV